MPSATHGTSSEEISTLVRAAKDAVENQTSARDWGREAIRLVVEDGRSVEGLINSTKQALGWHHLSGLIDSDAKRSKFHNYFSTLRYLVEGWACGAIPISKRNAVLSGETSFLWVYAQQKKLEKEETTNFDDAVEQLSRVRAFAETASPATARRLKEEVVILLELLEHVAPGQT